MPLLSKNILKKSIFHPISLTICHKKKLEVRRFL